MGFLHSRNNTVRFGADNLLEGTVFTIEIQTVRWGANIFLDGAVRFSAVWYGQWLGAVRFGGVRFSAVW